MAKAVSIKKIEADNKKAEKVIQKIVDVLLENSIKDNQTVLVKQWSPKKDWHFSKMKLKYYHPLYGLYPYFEEFGQVKARTPIAWNKVTFKVKEDSKLINL